MKKIITFFLMSSIFFLNVNTTKAIEYNAQNDINVESINQTKSTRYDWSTNPNGTQAAVMEFNPGQTKKIVGPWNGGFQSWSFGTTYVKTWTVSWSGSHYSNRIKIELCNGDTGEVIETQYGSGSAGSVTFSGQGISSRGINFYVTNTTGEWQAFWAFNVKNELAVIV